MVISFTGLASGIDVTNIVSQLVAIEKIPEQAIQKHQDKATSQISVFGDLSAKLTDLGTQATNLSTTAGLASAAARSSDESRITVSAASTASPATYSVSVSALAQTQSNHSAGFASNVAGSAGIGILQIQVGTGDPVSIDYGADDTLDGIARKINDSGAGVSASVLFDGTNYQLLVDGAETGAANTVTFSEAGDPLGLASPGSLLRGASDAAFTVNGIPMTRSSNQITDLAPGVSLSLASVTPTGSGPTKITISKDVNAVEQKLQAFLDAINKVTSTVHKQTTRDAAGTVGVLFGDPSLAGLDRQLGSVLGRGYPHGASSISLGNMGIKLANDGSLSLDATKFESVIAVDPKALDHLLVGETLGGGLAGAVKSTVNQFTQPGTGTFITAQTNLRAHLGEWDKQITQIESRATSVGDRLRRQYAALDQIVSGLNSQSAFLASMFK